MRFICLLFLMVVSFSSFSMCYDEDFAFLGTATKTSDGVALSEDIEINLNEAQLNLFQQATAQNFNFTSSRKFHCQFSNKNSNNYELTAIPLYNHIMYYRIESEDISSYIYVAVRIIVQNSPVFPLSRIAGTWSQYEYFNFNGGEINSKGSYRVDYKLINQDPGGTTAIKINNSTLLGDYIVFTEDRTDSIHYLAQKIKVKFNYTPTTCSFTDTAVRVNTVNYSDVKNNLSYDADAEVKIDCDQTVAYATRSVHYRFVSDNAVGNVLPNEYTNSDSAGNIGFELIKDGSVVNLSNNHYELIAWGDLKENVARNTIIPLKYKYTPYGDKIFKAGQVLSRVKIVIDYD
ncbi:hypothetical protein [Citrobacter freundii]|uniref:hypothetical protein n=1 Tax=Citrobacter freundii TaxID=546 RepID=UPI003ED8013C|nr:hypothetical protein [Citrobacter freundii]